MIENNLFFKKGIFSEDVDWFMRAMLHVSSMAVTNEVAYCYRLRDSSISHNVKVQNILDLFSSIENYASIFLHHENKTMTRGCLNYLAYQYFIVLGYVSNNLVGKDKSMMFEKLKKYIWIHYCPVKMDK